MYHLFFRWYDGFSTFYVNADGQVVKHVADKVSVFLNIKIISYNKFNFKINLSHIFCCR